MVEMQLLEKMMTEQFTEIHFEALLGIMDQLHMAAAAGKLNKLSPMDVRDVIGWLDDIIYTAEETIRELENALPDTNNTPHWLDN